MQVVVTERVRALKTAGIAMLANIPMIPTTIIISTRVKPPVACFRISFFILLYCVRADLTGAVRYLLFRTRPYSKPSGTPLRQNPLRNPGDSRGTVSDMPFGSMVFLLFKWLVACLWIGLVVGSIPFVIKVLTDSMK